ncbi:MAG TPA: SAM-dependent methyltransferase [Thermomicrobiales bacterium]|nr:SAM-dependent methyltransferase [Thermomicrobiales bacterium]
MIRDDLLAESQPELVELLQSEIGARGRVTFAWFMEQALSHPEHGYYTSGAARAGFAGDFLTASETHPIFGHALARQIAECWDLLGGPKPFVVREAGAGAGTLAIDILTGVRDERPDALAAMSYEVSDASERRVVEALARVADAGFGARVVRAGGEPFTGVLLANELLDAFPVHRLIVRRGALHELYVVWRDGWFADEIGALSSVRLVEGLHGLELAEGQRLEVSLMARDWAQGAARQLERGYAILIDYGYPARELYAAGSRFDGTLRTYSAHQAGIDPYRRVGAQDLTAHVDFTAISAAASDAGCVELGLTSQAFFFAGLGIEQLLMRLQTTASSADEYLTAREAVMRLLEPRGLGRFHVLALGRNVEPARLRGFSFTLP